MMCPAFVARTAAESPAGSGLRLLQAEQCSFDTVSTLPASLHVLSICNRLGFSQLLRDRLHLLLAPCAALRELYLLGATPCTAATLDLPLIAAACPALRVLVVSVSIRAEGAQVRASCTPACPARQHCTCCLLTVPRYACLQAVPYGKGMGVLPELEVLLFDNFEPESGGLILRYTLYSVCAVIVDTVVGKLGHLLVQSVRKISWYVGPRH